MSKKEFKIMNNVLEADGNGIMGIGTAKVGGYSVVMRVSMDYLERAIKIIKTLHKGEREITVDIAVTDDYPMIIGEYDKKTKSIAGVILAPRVKPD